MTPTKKRAAGTAAPARDKNGPRSVSQAFMQRMAPLSVQHEEIRPESTLMCQICLLNSVLERAANRLAEQHGLTLPQWMALGCIGHAGEEGIKHSELGKRLMLSKAPITGVVDRLERGGYVNRTADKIDRRACRIIITPKGEATWKLVRHTLRASAGDFSQCLSETEQQTLVTLLARVLDTAAKSDPILQTLG